MLIAVAIAEKVLGKGSKTPVTENVRDGGTITESDWPKS